MLLKRGGGPAHKQGSVTGSCIFFLRHQAKHSLCLPFNLHLQERLIVVHNSWKVGEEWHFNKVRLWEWITAVEDWQAEWDKKDSLLYNLIVCFLVSQHFPSVAPWELVPRTQNKSIHFPFLSTPRDMCGAILVFNRHTLTLILSPSNDFLTKTIHSNHVDYSLFTIQCFYPIFSCLNGAQ